MTTRLKIVFYNIVLVGILFSCEKWSNTETRAAYSNYVYNVDVYRSKGRTDSLIMYDTTGQLTQQYRWFFSENQVRADYLTGNSSFLSVRYYHLNKNNLVRNYTDTSFQNSNVFCSKAQYTYYTDDTTLVKKIAITKYDITDSANSISKYSIIQHYSSGNNITKSVRYNTINDSCVTQYYYTDSSAVFHPQANNAYLQYGQNLSNLIFSVRNNGECGEVGKTLYFYLFNTNSSVAQMQEVFYGTDNESIIQKRVFNYSYH